MFISSSEGPKRGERKKKTLKSCILQFRKHTFTVCQQVMENEKAEAVTGENETIYAGVKYK